MRAELTALFEKLMQELPSGTAELITDDHGIDLSPTKSGAASCSVHCDEFQVYSFILGTRSYWEFPYERRYRKNEKTVLEEIEEMTRAVITGDCEEQRGWFSLTGRIWVGDYLYSTTNLPMVPIPPFFVRRYEPYI